MTGRLLRSTAVFILATVVVAAPVTPAYGQLEKGPDYSKGKSQFPNLLGPYTPIHMGPPQLTNSPRIDQLIHEGKMQLSLQDALTLALENNLDISIQRYTPWVADTDILRTKAGGATRGLAGTGTAAVLGAIPAQTFDPQLTTTFSLDHRNIPVNNPFISGTGVALSSLTNHTIQGNFGYSQAFHTGTGLGVTWNNSRATTTSPAAVFNPALQSTVFVSFTQQLLNGFGLLPNTRFIIQAKNNKQFADATFALQVMTTISQVETTYWELVFARENVRVREAALRTSQKLYEDNQRQVEIGTLAPIEVVRAASEVATDRQNLIVAQTNLLQQQTLLKNLLTKNPLAAGLTEVEIVPTDSADNPPQVDLLPLPDAVKEAWQKRPEVKQADLTLKNSDVDVRATRNALLPVLSLFGQYGWTGLAGHTTLPGAVIPNTFAAVTTSPIVNASGSPSGLFPSSPVRGASAPLIEGLGDTFDQIFNNRFPTYSLQLSMNIPVRNRSAQADSARALLSRRQAEENYRRAQNSIVVDVRNAQIAVEQGRARVEAAVKARELARQTLDAEQKKFQLGASTIFFVIQAQRDLTTAEGNELRAKVDMREAIVTYNKAMGRTLEVNHITIADAKRGEVERDTLIPGTIRGEIIGAREKY